MISAKKIGRTIAIATLFGVALYSAIYFIASHSEAFEFIEQKIKNSQAIKTQVGDIKEIRPSLFGFYDQKTVGSDEWVSMSVHVTGVVRAIELDVKAKKINGTWVLETAENQSGRVRVEL